MTRSHISLACTTKKKKTNNVMKKNPIDLMRNEKKKLFRSLSLFLCLSFGSCLKSMQTKTVHFSSFFPITANPNFLTNFQINSSKFACNLISNVLENNIYSNSKSVKRKKNTRRTEKFNSFSISFEKRKISNKFDFIYSLLFFILLLL